MKTEVTEERYLEMLGVVPPIWVGNGFLVGEAHDHRTCAVTGRHGMASFAAYAEDGGKFYSYGNLTIAEFKRALGAR